MKRNDSYDENNGFPVCVHGSFFAQEGQTQQSVSVECMIGGRDGNLAGYLTFSFHPTPPEMHKACRQNFEACHSQWCKGFVISPGEFDLDEDDN